MNLFSFINNGWLINVMIGYRIIDIIGENLNFCFCFDEVKISLGIKRVLSDFTIYIEENTIIGCMNFLHAKMDLRCMNFQNAHKAKQKQN